MTAAVDRMPKYLDWTMRESVQSQGPILRNLFRSCDVDNRSRACCGGDPLGAARASLQSYTVPEWFRDAKFGIWSHWGPQSAIEDGE